MSAQRPVRQAARFLRRGFLAAALAAAAAFVLGCAAGGRAADPLAGTPRWFKGNLHTHSRWSDGADFPEMVADWYKAHGYHFLVVTDHNVLQEGEKWVDALKPKNAERLAEYRARWGDAWLETRTIRAAKDDPKAGVKAGDAIAQTRVRALAEYRRRFEEPGRFLLVMGEEITGRFEQVQVHVNAINSAQVIPPQAGANVYETLARDVSAVHAQRDRLRRPMLAILNHPNWGGCVPVDDWCRVPDLGFFEVVNTHPSDVYNTGDARLLSTDRLWDIALARRLGDLGLGVLYGVAADDSHDIHQGSGTAWVVVRATALSPRHLVEAMAAGDFYASTGVRLRDVRREAGRLAVEIDAEPGVTYRTQFIGTLAGYDRSRQDARDASGALLPAAERYSADVGRVLKEVEGPAAEYALAGHELYVRARVVSSRVIPPPKSEKPDEAPRPTVHETAWTQPLVAPAARK